MSVICATSDNAKYFSLGLQRRPIMAESPGMNLDRVTFSGGERATLTSFRGLGCVSAPFLVFQLLQMAYYAQSVVGLKHHQQDRLGHKVTKIAATVSNDQITCTS